MVCIYCQHDTNVINSRLQKKLNQVWRRRRCQNCNSVFTTLETINFQTVLAVAHKNAYKPFLRDKLLLSIHESLKHRKSALSDATAVTDTIISKLYANVIDGHIDRQQIIQTTGVVLKRFDKAAATHYQAYHPS